MNSRRRFIGTALGAGLAVSLPGCRQMEAQATRKRIIVDTQIHLWKASAPDLPWAPGQKPPFAEPFTYERFIAMMDEVGVDRALIAPPNLTGLRNDYALEAAQRYPGRFAVMGRINTRDPRDAALLPKWKDQPGMLGLRLSFINKDAVQLQDGTAEWIWPVAEKAGLPVMLLASEMGPQLARIAERHPQLTMIVDHMGIATPVAQAGRTGNAIQHTASLAKYPNVSVKLSATPAYSTEPYPFRDFDAPIRRLFDAFGPRRCYWGTDYTNSFARATYRERLTHFTDALDFLSEADKDWVLGRAILERLKWS
jgi:L-fuconolactonase